MTARLRIVKVGGSLFDLPDLPARLDHWFAAQPAAQNVLVCGGGRFADAVRQYDAAHRLPVEVSHRLALRSMTLSAELLAALWPRAVLIRSLAELRECRETVAIVDAWHFLTVEEPTFPGSPLPAGWHVTSDSIAARLAEVTGAAELVLLKSAPPPLPATAAHWSSCGYVDEHFAVASAKLELVRAIDLREESNPPHHTAGQASRGTLAIRQR